MEESHHHSRITLQEIKEGFLVDLEAHPRGLAYEAGLKTFVGSLHGVQVHKKSAKLEWFHLLLLHFVEG